jgi:hypothetical protein
MRAKPLTASALSVLALAAGPAASPALATQSLPDSLWTPYAEPDRRAATAGPAERHSSETSLLLAAAVAAGGLLAGFRVGFGSFRLPRPAEAAPAVVSVTARALAPATERPAPLPPAAPAPPPVPRGGRHGDLYDAVYERQLQRIERARETIRERVRDDDAG